MTSNRRQFLNRILKAGVAVLAGYVIYPVIEFLIPPSAALDQQTKVFVATTDELKPNSAKFFRFLDRPAVLVRLPNGDYKSLSAKCTHLGCTVEFKPSKDFFYCNCHGSEFNINGNVLKGPAVLPLPQYVVSISGNKIFVSIQNRIA